jgi:hypothetical protein
MFYYNHRVTLYIRYVITLLDIVLLKNVKDFLPLSFDVASDWINFFPMGYMYKNTKIMVLWNVFYNHEKGYTKKARIENHLMNGNRFNKM